jgi:hypothetical protein
VTHIGTDLRYTINVRPPEGWVCHGPPSDVNLVTYFSRRAHMAKNRFLKHPVFWQEGQDGNTEVNVENAGLKFFETLPNLNRPGMTLSAQELEEEYEGSVHKLVKGMINLNEGAVAEICGEMGRKFEVEQLPKVARAYHVQFATTLEGRNKMAALGFPGGGKRKVDGIMMAETALLTPKFIEREVGSTTMQELVYERGKLRGFLQRQAYVITLPELLEITPPSYCSLFTMYSWWLESSKIIKSRLHPCHWKVKKGPPTPAWVASTQQPRQLGPRPPAHPPPQLGPRPPAHPPGPLALSRRVKEEQHTVSTSRSRPSSSSDLADLDWGASQNWRGPSSSA